jgi:LuxR family maltose regulon positive regulatory protein
MNPSISLENQLLATKFYIPVKLGPLIFRPRLTALLDQSPEHPLTLISAPAGFGKTTLLSAWTQSLPVNNPLTAWVSLDEEDNDPQLFWSYVLTALNRQQPELFTPLLMQLQSPQAPPLKYLLTALINQLTESTEQFLLILDDYQVITEQQIHTNFLYLVEHLPAQLHIILSTRTDPPLPLSQLRARKQLLEVRTNQLRCTVKETKALFKEAMGIQLPDETIEQVTARTEGWLVGLQLLGLSLPEQVDPLTLLQEASGDQRYILDFLTQEVLGRQPQEVQIFLLSTCILERLTASLCDAVLQQSGSQQMLHQLDKANLFVISLDSKRQWYRYHALFAEALRYQLERTQDDLVPILHYRASLWYAEHDQITEAILHAFCAKRWQWAADLIERRSLSLMSHTWGTSQHALALVQKWLEQLPAEVVHSRPRLCMACSQLLWQVASPTKLAGWLDVAEANLTTSIITQAPVDASHPLSTPEVRQEQENLLGEVTTFRAVMQSHQEDGQAALSLCQRALTLLSPKNLVIRSYIGWIQLRTFYVSAANDAVAAVESGQQACLLAQTAGSTAHTISFMGTTAMHMIGTGRLQETSRLTQQAILLGKQPGGLQLPDVGWPTVWQAEILRERNQLDAALSLAQEAISLCQQIESIGSLTYILLGYSILLRIFLSRKELDAADSVLRQFTDIGKSTSQSISLHYRSFFTTVDQVRLWLIREELDHATLWAELLDREKRHGTPFAREREDAAYARVLVATSKPDLALQRLEPVLQRATVGKRWGHVIEIRLLQALAHQILQQETQALDALSEAVRLAEPEGYIRSIVDEGPPMEALLYQLRRRDRKSGPTPYLDTLLTAFQQESVARAQAGEPTKVQPLPEPLSERELQVLQLLARGESNLEIAQELVVVVDTVKRHVSHIFSKLGVHNRVQAVRQAQELGLLDDKL